MTATRSAAVAAAPRRAAAPAPDRRPGLAVVAPRRVTGAVAVVALVVVFGILLATAALNTALVSGQRDLDRVETDIREGEQRNQALRLRVAELESPERIVEAATAAGMVVPRDVRWITPQPDGTSTADVTVGPGAGDEAPADAPVDERADADGASGGPTG